MNQLLYLVSESFRGWKGHRSAVFPSLVTIFLCSILLSASLCSLCGGFRLLRAEGAFYTVEAFLKGGISAQETESIKAELLREKRIDSLEFISEARAMEIFRQQFSGEMLSLVEGNPLPASFRMQLGERYRSPRVLNEFVENLERMGVFDAVQAPTEWATTLAAYKFHLFFWPVLFVVLLLGTLALIIGNAVRLSLFSRKILVENMKYAGASRFFIVFPFALEGVMQGLLSSLLASLAVYFAASAVGSKFPAFSELFANSVWPIFATVLAVSCLAGYVSLCVVRSFLASDRGSAV